MWLNIGLLTPFESLEFEPYLQARYLIIQHYYHYNYTYTYYYYYYY